MENDSHDINSRAQAVFEQRNRAFRILYDTVLEITAASQKEMVPVLCKNLCLMTNAQSVAFATFDKKNKTLNLEAFAQQDKDVIIPAPGNDANLAAVDDEFIEIYKYTRLRKCLPAELCFDGLFPNSEIINSLACYKTSKCYGFSCVFEEELLACGIIELAAEQPFKMKDMVDTYLSMSGMILQRANAVKELERSKGRFKSLIENCPVGIAVVDKNRRIVEINSQALNMLAQQRENVLNKSCKQFLCVGNDGHECKYWGKSNQIRQEEKHLKCGPDKKIPILATIYPIEIDGEDYIIETFVDMTERKKQEEERLKLEKQLYQAQKLEGLGTLASGISHEINTPIQFINDNMRFIEESLANIIDSSQEFREFINNSNASCSDFDSIKNQMEILLKETEFDYLRQELPKALKETKEGLSRVADIVRAMKDFSHIDASERTLSDINKSVKSALMLTYNSWKYSAEVKTELDESLPEILCFINDINQAIMNIIINAGHSIEEKREKTGQEEKGNITVKTQKQDDNIVISISDTGLGIPDKIKDKIFEPFFTTKPVGKGTGQGLSMTYANIVEKHSGRFYFETENNKGTTFFIELPIIQG